ncbi:MAG TPA: DNA primase [Hyphomicrobiaceae bacterium]
MRFPPSLLDEIRARLPVSQVVARKVALKRAGRELKGLSPFKQERTPSFFVNDQKGSWFDFASGQNGDVFKFVMLTEGLSFPETVERLAQEAGLPLPAVDRTGGAREDERARLYALMEAALAFFEGQLAQNAQARRYLDRRGLSVDSIARFRLGYAPNPRFALKEHLAAAGFSTAEMAASGMLIAGDDIPVAYDRFRHRVMFPIRDLKGRVIAFGGRALDPDTPAKYLNSPETPLFHKGRELFGLWQVREAHQKIPRLIVVEGYMDVISLHQFGVPQAVATLGTATTRDHAEILFRQCADVYFCFDGDRAGRQAAWRAVDSVLPRMRDGRQAMFLFLPDGEDPDTLIRKEGTKGFEERLKNATPLSEFFFAEIGKDVNLASLDGKARLAERARPMLAQIPDGAFRDLMLAELDRLSGVRVQVAATAESSASRSGGARPPQRSLVRSAVALLVQTPGLAAAIEPPWTFAELRQPGIPLLIELIGLCRDRPEITTGALIEHFGERDETRSLQKLAVMDFPGGEDGAREEFLGALTQLEQQTMQQRIDDLLAKQNESGLADEEKDELRALLASRTSRA